MDIDNIYTPLNLALKLISVVKGGPFEYIADFAAGKGALLKTAQKYWPESNIIATDISLSHVSLVKKINPTWETGKVDFLNPRSRVQCKAISCHAESIPLILLNPPFSFRGGKYWKALYENESTRCSISLAFIVNSLNYLANNGQIIAILPAGSFFSQKDEHAWSLIKKTCEVNIVSDNYYKSFPGCSTKTHIVHITKHNKNNQSSNFVNQNNATKLNNGNIVEVIRGTTQMHSYSPNGGEKPYPLIHSTELKGNKNIIESKKLATKGRTICGPAVLLPRVGQPNLSKISLYYDNKPIIISDCVIALKSKKTADTEELYSQILKNGAHFIELYSGTCAQYITIKKLTNFLDWLGYFSHIN